ncbi:DUF411 domain-containing protein [Aquibium sp. A9E412]|uniref:DUF411 domain-containing protein n=1 Tax=Aquibium sp. A9E412 TaxID=2976767 RepID=UPI0025B2093E|nr:DUF411 domain-containing protein [Aquibium sp. A9E412]MDN2565967.1 DUF411 domain-containing protein [Aquibium sp. A9E412]
MRLKSALAAAAFAAAGLAPAALAAAETETLTVFKTPWCGCCHAWAEAMEKAGFTVVSRDLEDLAPVKAQAGVPDDMAACHTAGIGGYFVEGHVPLEAVETLLEKRPEIAGIAVPGMPQGSLGMGYDPAARYDVYAVSRTAGEAPSVFYRAGAN